MLVKHVFTRRVYLKHQLRGTDPLRSVNASRSPVANMSYVSFLLSCIMICDCERRVAAFFLWFQKEDTMWPCVCVCVCQLTVYVNRKACLRPSLAALYDLCMYVSSRGCLYTMCASHGHMVTWRGAAMTPERAERADTHQAAAVALYWTCVLTEAPVFTLDCVSLNQSFLWEHNRHWKEAISTFLYGLYTPTRSRRSQKTITYIITATVFFNTSSNQRVSKIDTTPKTKRTNFGQYTFITTSPGNGHSLDEYMYVNHVCELKFRSLVHVESWPTATDFTWLPPLLHRHQTINVNTGHTELLRGTII